MCLCTDLAGLTAVEAAVKKAVPKAVVKRAVDIMADSVPAVAKVADEAGLHHSRKKNLHRAWSPVRAPVPPHGVDRG